MPTPPKRKPDSARRANRIIQQRTLLLLGLLGGAPGALAAMKRFRHKTKHNPFWIGNTLGLIWQLALSVCLLKR